MCNNDIKLAVTNMRHLTNAMVLLLILWWGWEGTGCIRTLLKYVLICMSIWWPMSNRTQNMGQIWLRFTVIDQHLMNDNTWSVTGSPVENVWPTEKFFVTVYCVPAVYVKHKNMLWMFQKVCVQTDGVFKYSSCYVELKQIHFMWPCPFRDINPC